VHCGEVRHAGGGSTVKLGSSRTVALVALVEGQHRVCTGQPPSSRLTPSPVGTRLSDRTLDSDGRRRSRNRLLVRIVLAIAEEKRQQTAHLERTAAGIVTLSKLSDTTTDSRGSTAAADDERVSAQRGAKRSERIEDGTPAARAPPEGDHGGSTARSGEFPRAGHAQLLLPPPLLTGSLTVRRTCRAGQRSS